jgi:hypothetical protein
MNLGQIDTRGTEVAPLIPINSDDDKDKEVRYKREIIRSLFPAVISSIVPFQCSESVTYLFYLEG